MENKIDVQLEISNLEEVQEKVNALVSSLKEAKALINDLAGVKQDSKDPCTQS